MRTGIGNTVLRSMVHGHVLLASGAAAQVWWADELLHLHAGARLIAFAALATFAAYGAMRLLRMDVPGLSGSATMVWYRARARTMALFVGASAIAAAVIGWSSRSLIVHALWLPALLAACYILPVALTRGRPIGLRRVPFLKAFIIAFVWASMAVVLPGSSLAGDPHIGGVVWWVMSVWCCFFLAIAITFDIRDLPHDMPSLRTVPQVFGARGAKVIALLLLLPILLFFIVSAVFTYHPIEVGWREPGMDLAFALPIPGLLFMGVLIARAGAQRPWWWYEVLLDGSLLLLPLLTWLGGLFGRA